MNDLEYRAKVRREARDAGDPIDNDTVIQVARDEAGNPRVDSIKAVWRPAEEMSKPIKPHWLWVWVAIIVLTVLAWIFLFWYFTSHQAPYAAPIS
jgi:hypothetical protein